MALETRAPGAGHERVSAFAAEFLTLGGGAPLSARLY